LIDTIIETVCGWLGISEEIGVWCDYIAAVVIFLLFLMARGIFTHFIFKTILRVSVAFPSRSIYLENTPENISEES